MPWSVYEYYIRSGKWILFLLTVLFFLLACGARLGSSYWLSLWTSKAADFYASMNATGAGNGTTTDTASFNNAYWIWSYIGWAAAEVIGLMLGMCFGTAFSDEYSTIPRSLFLIELNQSRSPIKLTVYPNF